MASLNPYGKVDEADQIRLYARRKTRKRIAVISLSSLILVLLVVSAVVGTSLSKDNQTKSSGGGSPPLATSIKAVCATTLYPDTCYTSLAPLANNSNQFQPGDLFKLAVQVAVNELSEASAHFLGLNGPLGKGEVNASDSILISALESCNELLGLALDHLNDSLSATNVNDLKSIEAQLDDLMTWLSTSGTCLQTCIDGFENLAGGIKESVSGYLQKSGELTSNGLAIVKGFSGVANSLQRRRLMSLEDHIPGWLSPRDRNLLQKTNPQAGIKRDVVVAKDGSGNYKTIGDALNAVPAKSKKRFVIYVKKGVYYENVKVDKTKWNVFIFGDGMNSTIVSGSLNFVDGIQTFASATFAVFGKGFIARDMGFRNSAGAAKHQAVALLSSADQSVFYRCRMDAFQDTLYTHSNRQFYRECNIYGTVDFIFGNSAVVFQNCNILPRKPMLGQENTITAQGKFDPNQNTGISIQNCNILPSANLSSVQTFLGRPWKTYSTTVYLNNMMGNLIDPKGWLPWVGTTAPDTIFYAEFANYGPGSSTKGRVTWKGLKYINSKQASKFTVDSFINGNKWIAAAGVGYKPGL